jgi:NADH:ubiquinone oxidoreductase subunit 4 (subunit M)
LWLPKAHVEAPAIGSIILAAVLLKLSAYGFVRVVFFIKRFLTSHKEILISLLLLRSFFSALICLLQADVKSLVAYSSIRHMGVMLIGFVLQNFFSFQGLIIIILAHGFCSSMLFFLSNFQYERNLTRQLLLARGQINYFYYLRGF